MDNNELKEEVKEYWKSKMNKVPDNYRLFQERMNLPGCAVDLSEKELKNLKKEGLI